MKSARLQLVTILAALLVCAGALSNLVIVMTRTETLDGDAIMAWVLLGIVVLSAAAGLGLLIDYIGHHRKPTRVNDQVANRLAEEAHTRAYDIGYLRGKTGDGRHGIEGLIGNQSTSDALLNEHYTQGIHDGTRAAEGATSDV